MPTVNAGDLRINYIEGGDPNGEPIVFVHGNWATCSWWEPVLALLPPGYRGIAYDLRGRGLTQAPDNDYTMAEHAADLQALADGLGLGSLHLVGHSLGSAVAMEYALEHPGSVHTLVAVAPAWVDGMPEAYNVPAGQQMIKADKAMFAGALKALAPAAPDDAFWQRLVDEGHNQRLEAALKNLPALVDWHPGDELGRLAESGVRTLVVSGALDPLTGGANAERAAQALRARHVLMQGIGHSPIIEAPEEFVRILMEEISR
jgi:pimeloyl-ACP methyl ester carboxylesterase